MEFNDLLKKFGIDSHQVLVLRHRPHEPGLRKVLPWLAAEKPDVFNAYQQTQSPRVEKAMLNAQYVASFFGHAAGKALFIGLYKRGETKLMSYEEYWSHPAYMEMKSFGMQGFQGERENTIWFELENQDFYSEWRGRLVVHWPGRELSWWRWADRNSFLVDMIFENSQLTPQMLPWNEFLSTWEELKALPSSWKATLSEWRGIYFILDTSDGKGYVGSAYGGNNILGRWQNYSATGHGGNKKLKRRDPRNFVFSILQRVSPDMEAAEIIRLEKTWKDRLHTGDFGLNDN